MVWLLSVFIAGICITWEDFTSRQVRFVWYPIMLAGLLGYVLQRYSVGEVLFNTTFNFLFIGGLLVILALYFSVKEGRLISIFDRYIGWGDILFFSIITVFFTVQGYILFTVISLVLALLVSPLFFYMHGKEKQVPLAGIQCTCLLVYILYTAVFKLG